MHCQRAEWRGAVVDSDDGIFVTRHVLFGAKHAL